MSNLPKFKQKKLLTKAFTHRSALNENVSSAKESNERLEFLGDAVLELVTTEYLFSEFPQEPEGILTAYRSALVKTTTLAKVAKEIGLGDNIYMSKGEEAGGGRANEGLLADTFEAVVGALYLDQGIKAVEQFLNDNLFPRFKEIKDQKLYKDPKSHLQEVVQARGYPTPIYSVTGENGPDHDKEFTVSVRVGGKTVGVGKGRSKQTAQQAAASKALEEYSQE